MPSLDIRSKPWDGLAQIGLSAQIYHPPERHRPAVEIAAVSRAIRRALGHVARDNGLHDPRRLRRRVVVSSNFRLSDYAGIPRRPDPSGWRRRQSAVLTKPLQPGGTATAIATTPTDGTAAQFIDSDDHARHLPYAATSAGARRHAVAGLSRRRFPGPVFLHDDYDRHSPTSSGRGFVARPPSTRSSAPLAAISIHRIRQSEGAGPRSQGRGRTVPTAR